MSKSTRPDQMGLIGDLLMEVADKHLTMTKEGESYRLHKTDKDPDPFFKYLLDNSTDGKSFTIEELRNFDNPDVYAHYHNWSSRKSAGIDKYINLGAKHMSNVIKGAAYVSFGLTALYLLTEAM
ncbi:hypothetical protein [Companilactobacillus ginsenosidimutans]|uniref:hypothetical protein n=1 Tax=Companilactobacillus ginsenosidimutans TaxID=1007676 RepID=UPI0012EE338D|nr:hypothetical protein [Companilactobacillus ginsenosidimutans]